MIGVNGAFLVAPITGVQRFAFQLLIGLLEARPDLKFRVYVPPLAFSKTPLLDQLRVAGAEIVIGPRWARSKQVFEQIGLPRMAFRDRVSCLVHLNNNVSLLRRGRQVCFVYDLAPIRLPDTYRLAYRLKFRATIAAVRRRKPAIVTLSEFSRRELESVGVAVCGVVRAGIGSPMLAKASQAPEAGPISVPDGRYALVFGSADPRKRVDEVIAAWAPVFAELGLKLLVVQGIAPTHRQDAAGEPSRQGVQRLQGRISDSELVGLVRSAQCAIFASQYEGGALAAEEVLALGTPVVASDIATFRELLAPTVTFFDDFADLPARCAHVLAGDRPAALTLEQTSDSWRLAGSALADVIAGG
jgi:glycosyltransferase involved in cell wall biosynthesis